jgi:hypothetical protein
MKLQIILPILYLIAALFLFFGPPGGAGHGWGLEASYYLSMPAAFLVVLLTTIIPFTGVPIFAIFLLFLSGTAQYFFLGRLLDKLAARRRKKGERA